jgi:hypothetical protein
MAWSESAEELGVVVMLINRRTHLTLVMIGHPYRVHNKHISCSQKLDKEQFEASLSEVRKEMNIITTQVFI